MNTTAHQWHLGQPRLPPAVIPPIFDAQVLPWRAPARVWQLPRAVWRGLGVPPSLPAGGYWWWEKPSRSASDKLGTTSSSSPRQDQDAAILPACPCEQPTTRNKSEIVTIHTDFHHATFPPISSPREKPRGRPPPSGAHPKIRACDWSSSACRALIGREPAEFPAQKRSLKGWLGCATRLVCLSSAAELSFERSALQTDGSQGASSALLANNHFLSDGDTHQHRFEHRQENKKIP